MRTWLHSWRQVNGNPKKSLPRNGLRMRARPITIVAAALLGLLLARATHAAPINGLSIFGDSLSDPGNNELAPAVAAGGAPSSLRRVCCRS